MLDYKLNNINILNNSININLKDNYGNVNIGDSSASQQAILGNNFLDWFDEFIENLMGAKGGPYLGNLGSPVVANPDLIECLTKYQALKSSKFLSHNVNIVDNDQVSKKDRPINSQIGDAWNSTIVKNDLKKESVDFKSRDGIKQSVDDPSYVANGFVSHNSADSVQIFKQRGFASDRISVDTTPEPYDMLKSAIYEQRISMYNYEPLYQELIELQEDLSGGRRKIDHPPKGKKDLSDCLAATVFTLSKQKLSEPLPIMKGMSYAPDAWMEEQRQLVSSGPSQPSRGTTFLPPIMGGGMGMDDDPWKSPWRP
jgi:hypothetical protein